jgi:23S rRNA (cytosine1962-C5)-methyltransferase
VIPTLTFKPQKEERLLQGSLWVFRADLDLAQKDYAPGSLVRLATAKGRPLALGFVNTRSSIAVRVLARSGELPDEEDAEKLLSTRLEQAFQRRGSCLPGLRDLRLVFSEGDCLPGLVVDRFGEVLVVQLSTAGMEARRDFLFGWLKARTGCRALVERSEGFSREKEGLPSVSGLVWKAEGLEEERLKRWPLEENGWSFEADLLGGQKTGFFFDQRDTRRGLGSLSAGLDCLDAFCHTGAFSVALAAGGARTVLGLDSSAEALDLAGRNAALNHFGQVCAFEKADAFVRLRELEKSGRRFGLICLDPPAFTKSKEGLEGALRGYKEINYRALKLLERGGTLVTCSCTQAVEMERFLKVVRSAAADAGCLVQVLRQGGQPPDHPSLLGMPETRYLKSLVLQKS